MSGSRRRHGTRRSGPGRDPGTAPVRAGLIGGSYQPLSQQDIERIHRTSLDVLENYGLADPIDSCRDLVLEHGGWINKRGRLSFPRALVEDVLPLAGRDFVLYGRDTQHDLNLSGSRVHFSGSTAAVKVLDVESGLYRDSTLRDVYDIARLEDTLPNMHFVHRPCIARDMPDAEALDINTAYALMSATTKHFITSFFEPEHLDKSVDMYEHVLVGGDRFRHQPFCTIVNAFVVPPLRFAADSCRTFEAAVRRGMPIWAASAGQAGSTSPTALAGALVQGNAECLAALVYANLLSPGHPLIFGNWPFVSDLRSGATCGGGEMALLNAAAVQLAHYYDIPVTVGAGIVDSKVGDVQAGWERGYSTAMAGLAGGNIIVGAAGGQAALMGFSMESLVVDDDMLGAVLRGVRGIEVNDETLSYEVIGEVIDGPGHFLAHEQTLSRMTRDYVYPDLGNRDSIEDWEASGRPDIREAARQRVKQILSSHYPDYVGVTNDEAIRAMLEIRLPRDVMRPGTF